MTNENANNSDENICINSTFRVTQIMLSKGFLAFVHSTAEAIVPETFEPKAQWAIEHDNTYDYNADFVLNSESKNKLDSDYTFMTGPDGSARQVLHLMEESTPTDKNEIEIKDRTITYITTWLELMHAFYTNFLAGVTIDEESFEDKYVRVRSELIDRTNKLIINDYIQYMKEYEEWSSEDVERFLAGDDPLAEVPESFSQSYYADLGLLD